MIHIADIGVQPWYTEAHRLALGAPPMKKTVNYYCNTSPKFGKDLWITTREGLSFRAESKNLFNVSPTIGKGLVVIVHYEVQGEVRRNLVELFDDDNLRYCPELAIIKKQMEDNRDFPMHSTINHNRPGSYCLIYLVPEERLQVEDGSVYVNQLDIVVSRDRTGHWDQMHPYSARGAGAGELIRVTDVVAQNHARLAESDFIYALTIVDNGDGETIGPRYIDSGDGIIKITPRSDLSRPSGIYAAFRNPADLPGTEPKLKLLVSTDGSDIPWLVLHETPDEAKEYRRNDVSTQAQLKLRELSVKETEAITREEVANIALERARQDAANLANSLEVEKAKNANITLNLSNEREKFENQQKELRQQLETNAAKHKQELSLARMKNQGEFLKSGTSIVQGIIGVALLCIKLAK